MRYPYWRLALLLVSLLGVVAVAAACGGDDNSGDDEPEATKASNTAESDGGGDEETPGATEGTDDGDALEDLRDAASAGPSVFYLEYEIETVGSTEEESFSGTFVLAADDPKELFSIKTTEGDVESELTIINDGETSYFCSVEEGQEEGSCLESPSDSAPFGDLTGSFFTTEDILEEITSDDTLDVRRVGSKEVAGLDTECYEVTGEDTEATVCVAPDENIMAEAVGTFEGTDVDFRLTEWDEDPDDSVFEPPYEVVDLGG